MNETLKKQNEIVYHSGSSPMICNSKNTEEYRGKRRAAYAAKHANDTMTEHRRACIDAAKKRMKTPLDERMALKAANKDMQDDFYMKEEKESEIRRETVIKYIRKFSQRTILFRKTIKNGETMSEADIKAYYKEANKYLEIQERLDNTEPMDYTTRNILSYKLRCIEEHFKTILKQRQQTNKRLKSE